MMQLFLGGIVFLFLLLAAVPVIKLRRGLLTLAYRVLNLMLLVLLVILAILFLRPNLAPPQLTEVAALSGKWVEMIWPDAWPGLPWLLLAILVTGVSLPILMFLYELLRLDRQATAVGQLLRHSRLAIGALGECLGLADDAHPGAQTRHGASDMDRALDVVDRLTSPKASNAPKTRRVRDYLGNAPR